MAEDLQKLLKYIVHHYTGQEELKDVELEATSTNDVPAEQQRALDEEEQRANQLGPAFQEGIIRAIQARKAGGSAISLDDRKPLDNQIADALVHFLVGAGLAESSTRETDPMHYIYTISVDWERLSLVARQAGASLDGLAKQAS